jgi:hypothetical protein
MSHAHLNSSSRSTGLIVLNIDDGRSLAFIVPVRNLRVLPLLNANETMLPKARLLRNTLLALSLRTYHAGTLSCNVLDGAVLSYAASSRSLSFARERTEHLASKGPQGALIANMSERLDQNHSLTLTMKSKKWITFSLSKNIGLCSPLTETSRSHISNSNYQIVHFVCHGQSTLNDPSEGFILLDD